MAGAWLAVGMQVTTTGAVVMDCGLTAVALYPAKTPKQLRPFPPPLRKATQTPPVAPVHCPSMGFATLEEGNFAAGARRAMWRSTRSCGAVFRPTQCYGVTHLFDPVPRHGTRA